MHSRTAGTHNGKSWKSATHNLRIIVSWPEQRPIKFAHAKPLSVKYKKVTPRAYCTIRYVAAASTDTRPLASGRCLVLSVGHIQSDVRGPAEEQD